MPNDIWHRYQLVSHKRLHWSRFHLLLELHPQNLRQMLCYLSVYVTNEYQKQERAENRPLWYSRLDICWHTLRTINNYCLFVVGQEGM